ncbi:MAG: RNA polymerase subunit sigma-24 [Planctomycetes bacterium]|nr:RNA polymerase subunit sigma-24 [Planctomycetota bacterium]
MRDANTFAEFFRRVRAGDQDAAIELVREYEPEIRREVRLRLTDPKLRRTVDSMDICQSVLGNFFVRAALGQFDLVRPEDLLRLLVKMARNKVIDRHRRQKARSDREQTPQLAPTVACSPSEPVDPGPSPSSIVAGKELLSEVRRRMTDEERRIAEARKRGQTWDEVAESCGGSAEALRKRLARTIDRIVDELGLDEH